MFINCLGLLDSVSDAVRQLLRTASGRLSAIIYEFIATLYKLFIYISKAEILEDSFVLGIYRRVGMILSLFMLFKLIFSLIQSLVDPNKLGDEKSGFGAIIKRSIISIVLLGITPTLFREAFKIQNIIVGSDNSNNIIYKLIVNNSATGSFETLGKRLSSTVFFCFFTEKEGYPIDQGIRDNLYNIERERFEVDNFTTLVEDVSSGDRSFDDTVDYLMIKSNNVYHIDYNGVFSIAFGLAVVYLFLIYCLQVATRVIQLAYLQIIAPIPILSYISDPEGTFKNWTKQCITTYLDLFFRLAIIYFVMTILGEIITQFGDAGSIIRTSTGLTANGTDATMLKFVKLFIILGLLMFAKRVPDLFKELFPNFGGGAAGLKFGFAKPKDLIGGMVGGGLANKAIGLLGKGAKKGVRFATSKATAPMKNRYNNWKNERNNHAEVRRQEKPGEKLWNKYNNQEGNIENAFKNSGYKASYQALSNAKKENSNAIAEYDRVKNSGNQSAIDAAIKRRDAAAKNLSQAQSRHDFNRKKFGSDARVEDNYDMYKKMNGLEEPAKIEERRIQSEIATRAEREQQSARQASEAQNNYNEVTGVSRKPASTNGAPTAENSLLAELADQSRQQELQQEYIKRGENNDSASSKSNNNGGWTLSEGGGNDGGTSSGSGDDYYQ